MIGQNEIITFANGKRFNVIHSFMMDGINYVFLFEDGNPKNVMYMKYVNDELLPIDDEDELKRYYDKLKEDLL